MSTWKSTSNSDDSDESSCCSDDSDESYKEPSVSIPEQYRDPFNESKLLNCTDITDDILSFISEYISGYWKQVGRGLKTSEVDIEAIDIDFDKDGEKEKGYQVLLGWERQMGRSATVGQLKDVITPLVQKKLPAEKDKRTMLEIKHHIKLQKQALQELNKCLKFYQGKVSEIKELSCRDLQDEEARASQEKLRELNDTKIQNQLDNLQKELKSIQDKRIQDKSKEYVELDDKIRDVAEKLCKVEKTVVQYEEILADVLLIECKSHSLCPSFGVKLPRVFSLERLSQPRSSSTNEKKNPGNIVEAEDDVFKSPNKKDLYMQSAESEKHPVKAIKLSKQSHVKFTLSKDHEKTYRRRISQDDRSLEGMHVRRKLNVSSLSMDEQFQLKNYIFSVSSRKYREDKPFIFSHSCISQHLQQTKDLEEDSRSYKNTIQTWYI